MARKFIKCPYCGGEYALSGIRFHVKNKHPDNYEEFKGSYDTLKAGAYLKDGSPAPAPKPDPKPAPDPKPEAAPQPPKPTPAPAGGDEPQGKSFLDQIIDTVKAEFEPY